MTRLVVIGGGISGLATAFFVRDVVPDAEITVLEDSDRLGGNIRTLHEGGMPVEAGPDAVMMARPEVGALFARLGLEMVAPDAAGRVLVASDGALRAFPEGLVFGMPTRFAQLAMTPLLSMRGKLRAALDLVLPAGPTTALSLGALIERRLGREVKERLVEPMVGGVLAADIDCLDPASLPMVGTARGSLIRAMAGAKRPGGSPLRAPSLGMSLLVDALEREVGASSVRLGTGAVRVLGRAGAFTVETRDGSAISCDHVVLAVPPHVASELLSELDPALALAVAELSAATTATVLLVFPPGTQLPSGSGMLVPRSEGKSTLAATFVNAKWDRPTDTGEVVVRAILGGARSPTLVEQTDDAGLTALALADLRAYLVLPDPLRSVVVRFGRATPQPTMGHADRIAHVRSLAARHAGLALVSAAYEGPGIAGCIAQASRVGAAMSKGQASLGEC